VPLGARRLCQQQSCLAVAADHFENPEAVKHFGPNGGSVINISSIASAGEPTAAIYSGTKGAMDAITRGLAAELGPRIRRLARGQNLRGL
jgi:NAD(P)-dependent dehydrogenase (short-subunit alcohol dehydrogenase family)